MSYRTPDEFIHCPKKIADICNKMAEDKYSTQFIKAPDAIDYMRLLFFNDPIPQLHTHNYGYNTRTGRAIIEQLKSRYYEHKSTD